VAERVTEDGAFGKSDRLVVCGGKSDRGWRACGGKSDRIWGLVAERVTEVAELVAE
jgi:hypothetical protein